MQLITRLFPALSYLDPASEAAFRCHLVNSARQGTARLAFLGKYSRFENLAPGSYQFDDE